MYTFADRGGPLADAAAGRDGADRTRLRRARTAPRAAAGEALHDRADVPLRARRGRGRYREHWQVSVEAIGSDDPAIDAEVIQLYDKLLRRLGVTEYQLELNSIGDRACRPAYVERLEAWLDAHAGRVSTRTRGRSARRARCGCSTTRREAPAVPSCARRRARRSATRSATPAPSTSPTCARYLDALRRRLRRSCRRSSAASTTTRARRSSSSGPMEDAQLDDRRRRPLRRARRGDRRPADAGNRLRRRDRAPAARARARPA